MTHTKKLRLLNEYDNKDFVAVIIRDRFDPTENGLSFKVRETFKVSDIVKQYEDKEGIVYTDVDFRELYKNMEKEQAMTFIKVYQDTFEKNHEVVEKQEKKLLDQYASYLKQIKNEKQI